MQSRHGADLVGQAATDADAAVAEIIEQPDQLALQAADEGRIAHAGNVLHRALADALAHAATRLGVEVGVERGGGPVDQSQSVDAPVQAAADTAEVERA